MLADSDHVAADGPRSEVQRSLLRAWSAELVGAHRMALDQVDAALGRAEPEGLVAVFLESDPVVLGLVEELVPARGGLAAVIAGRRDPNPPPDANAHLPEPLTDRELEILGHLPDHSTSAELARQCFVSVNTIKTHTTHIYRKLGVSGRSAAIARARELGLLGGVIREWERA
jgi:LuxR family maltose regulon positive regulatory protein